MANETSSAQISETIPASEIDARIREWPYAEDLTSVLCDFHAVPAGNGPVFTVARHNILSVPAGAKTEGTAAFSRVQATTDGVDLTAGTVGFELWISREAQHDSRGGIPASILSEGLNAMRARRLSDALATINAAGVSVGDAATEPSLALIQLAITAAETMSLRGPLGIVLGPTGMAAIRAELLAEGAGQLEASGMASDLFAKVGGFVGTLFGCALFCSPAVPTEGTTAEQGMLFSMTPGNRPIVLAEWDPLHVETLPRPDYYVDAFYLVNRYAVALAHGTEATPGATCVEINYDTAA